ncbi:beta-N-acetylhexosaminidase [Dactylosporangium sp. NPDC049742]|uniref:beta-N-acetylhexosaminidase n=1 Tax=Dactylosporangium sp. NPDC049742 TaxID=3154737 RepID=UPI00341F8924
MIPRPSTVEPDRGEFRLTPATTLSAAPGLERAAAWLRATLGPATGCFLPPGDDIRLSVDRSLPDEGYRLRITADGVNLTGGTPAGVFHGLQSLLQVLPPEVYRRAPVTGVDWLLPAMTVDDAPRWPWRGCMLDVARHFMPKADVLRFVDLLSVHKLNVLHLHLTDDQGWRLPIPGYPRLVEIATWRHGTMRGSRQHGVVDDRPHGGYYTADDLREIVAYAADRHITVVPEVDLPGHMQAAVAAYPQLGNGLADVGVRTGWGVSPHVLNVSDAALDFCRAVIDELCAIFPGRYIGIGGDECPKDEWKASPAAQDRMRELGLPDETALQAWFVGQVAGHIAGHGRTVHGWDEILEGGAPGGALIAAWRGPEAAVRAVRAGHHVVSCPDMWTYLDYRQSDAPDEPIPVGTRLSVADVYTFDPVPPGLTLAEAGLVLGAQCNVWTEHLPSARAVDYAAFPRLASFAEVMWSGPAEGFTSRLASHLDRLDALGVEYRPPGGPHPWQRRPDAQGFPKTRAQREAEIRAMLGAPFMQ